MIQPLPLALSLADSAGGAPVSPPDSTVDQTLLGDKVTPIIQFLFQKEPWVMWAGAVLAAAIAIVILVWLWRRRQAILGWLSTRNTRVKTALIATVVLAVLAVGGLAFKANQFVATDKRFCNGCHIFVGTGHVWVQPDSGNYTLVPKLEGKHDSIGCHTCHPLNPRKEGIKLVLWMSGFREDTIPPHARVPRKICEGCHVRGDAKEKWQAIAATAGHRTHLESDSSTLKGKVECLTCHALTAHRFPPADSTCGQSACHKPNETKIVLGKMKGQGEFHCVGCHQFTASVPLLATRDSAASTLTPAIKSCFRCHAMQQRLPDFDERKDPHKGTCGMCHNPHTQTRKEDAVKTCSTRECHGLWNQVPFHAGAQHRKKATQCTLCHAPHAARVDASDCVGCHQRVRDYAPGQRLFPPLPFDTSAALRQSMAPVPPPAEPERPSKVKGDAPPLDAPRPSVAPKPPVAEPERPNKAKGDSPPGDDSPGRSLHVVSPLPSDSFPHPRHKKLACLTCHLSTSQSKLTFEPPRGCQICHHQDPAKADCTKCHERDSLPEIVAVPVSVTAARKPPRERTVSFRHERHKDLKCTACHGQTVTMAPVDSAITCKGCHDKHHEPARHCAECHQTATITEVHAKPPAHTHVACDACHATAAIAALTPNRNLCLACHPPAVDHHPEKECSACHLQASPETYRARLLRPGKTG